MVYGLLAGLVLAGASWLGWQYWMDAQRSSLMPVASSVPAPQAQGVVEPPPEAMPAASEPAAPAPEAAMATAPPTAPAVPAPPSAPVAAVAPTPPVPQPQPPAQAAAPVARTAEPAPARREAPASAPAASAPAARLVRSQAPQQLQDAWAALRQGNAAQAQSLYQQVLAERPDDPDATLGLAVSLHRQHQLDAAWAAYQRSLQLWPDNETARTGLLTLLSESEPGTAESRLQEWVQAHPRDADAQAALGRLLGRQGRWAEAMGPLALAQALAPSSAAHAYNLAVALDQARRYEDALRLYRQALQLGAVGVPVKAAQRRIDELQELWAR